MQSGVVSKSEFARIIAVSPGRVSQMIADGTIGRDALVGEGRSAKVDLRQAKAQIASRRDIGQALGNGLSTRLEADEGDPALDLAAEDPAPAEIPPQITRGHSVEDQIKQERLARERRANRQAEEEDAKRRGTLMDAEQARSEMNRIASTMITTFEGALPDMATAIAAKFELPQRDVLHELKRAFTDMRTNAESRERRRIEAMPKVREAVIVAGGEE